MSGHKNAINYDNKYDILYIFTATPRIAYEDEIEPGIFLRKDDTTDEIVGATISGYKNMDKSLLDDLIPFVIDHKYINENYLNWWLI